MNRKLSFTAYLMALLLLGASMIGSANAETTQEKGLRIASEIKAKNKGWGNSEGELQMTLRTRKGAEILRKMRIKSFEVDGDGDKSLTIFDTPADVKGTAFLTHSHTSKNDDQWIYLPALKRVKRIASRNKSGPFLGSEFSFEDLSSFELEKYQFNFLMEEPFNDQNTFVIEMVPSDKNSGYSKVHGWVDQDHYRWQKLVFYDRRGTLLKTLSFVDYQLYEDKFWRPMVQKMVNHKNGKSTDINVKSLEFGVGLQDADFDDNKLKRAR